MRLSFLITATLMLPVPAFALCAEGEVFTTNAPKNDAVSQCRAKAECDYRTKYRGSPQEVQSLLDLQEACRHFSGEFNGDQSARDREVFAEMDKLRCSALETHTLEMVKKYWRQPVLAERILFASERHAEAFFKCDTTNTSTH